MDPLLTSVLLGAGALGLLPAGWRRLELSRAKHRSLTGHARMSRLTARLLPYYSYPDSRVFALDDAPPHIVEARRVAFAELALQFRTSFSESRAMTALAKARIADLQFTSAYRVPYQFRELVRGHLDFGSFVQSSEGVYLTDLDGNRLFDVTGSYGVNLFGNDFYKHCIEEGARRVRGLGPVLGSYHPIVADNVRRLTEIADQDEVSFHMSGTEAVMQAVRLARYHTGRSHLVRFCGAYHGWWDDVQPGIGNPSMPAHTYTLAELSDRTLQVLRTRKDIACVLVNPLQALHPNRAAPGDSSLVDSQRSAGFDRDRYTEWLRELRRVCTQRGIVLIFDEVFVGFRLAARGAQAYFGVQADLVTYGKTLGGGLPVGVLCGRRAIMRRYRDDRPADICFARGTFNSHPYVMGAMQVFLEELETPRIRALYATVDRVWDERAEALNARLRERNLPVQLRNLSSIWTTQYTVPSRYNWMFQYYLRAHSIALSWVGTGRMVFSLNYTNEQFEQFAQRFVDAAAQMRDEGWWWHDGHTTNRTIRRSIVREMIRHRLGLDRPAHAAPPEGSAADSGAAPPEPVRLDAREPTDR